MSIDENDLYAHSENKSGTPHDLTEHLVNVARLAGEFAGVFGAAALGWWLGVLHDLGKAADVWQQGLRVAARTQARVNIDHKAAGTRFAVRLGLWRWAMAVHGHHGGLTTPVELQRFLTSPKSNHAAEKQALDRMAALVPQLGVPSRPELPEWARKNESAGELLLRMVFSALVDADFLDTAQHFRPQDAEVDTALCSPGVEVLLGRFEAGRRKALDQRPAAALVDGPRERVYQDSVRTASLPQGFFRLGVPTGFGKTYAMAGFGLHHAKKHGLRRVIVAVPYLSVTDQVAEEYRTLLDPDRTGQVVLEHHSGVDLDAVRQRAAHGHRGRSARWQRLAAENWDAEFIVTTTVQLLESLHDRHPGRMRKLHRLAGSVIVIDEVQALPVHLLEPVLLMLRQLVEHFDVTVLLVSATQPEFWDLPVLEGREPVDLVDNVEELYTGLRRVRYRWWTEARPSLTEVAREVAENRRALVVVNTTDHARTVFRQWEAMSETGSLASEVQLRHLSTRMCSRHRLDVIKDIRKFLAEDVDVLVASTQLIEAGVDLDFPLLYRAMAPAEALLQAAGRCNRDGRLGHEGGLVVVFDPREPGRPPTYELPLHETRIHFGPGRAQPDDLAALRRYFPALYESLGPEALGHAVVTAREEWDFVRTAELFRMIADDTVPVLVDYTPAKDPVQRTRADRVVTALKAGNPVSATEMRRLQPFLATVPRTALSDNRLVPLAGNLHRWTGPYHPHFGIDLTSEKS
ncbi:CRISPR-associated helicase/endonuclease Cas3 [Actinosynnema sp. NPDC047251]|uniref:CRISPR-associated helicase Cas3 family protein protein n=1 Tax=Saccharothrix espanaensis (strain ATCC 51144 / DSM 44229 / JCM 9112 / NBRC 15066 / NRRL 15764) TaxID=1179773 RepID=K0JTS9_SACES|nr:CRISPR-associated helicase/endonuclease Cas3 [Saccharothrix espanaensis]CCH29336.1 CRISPR-associated helicase Cas3 family protein protein [Saccharothrix espanaensis DSM 44229]